MKGLGGELSLQPFYRNFNLKKSHPEPCVIIFSIHALHSRLTKFLQCDLVKLKSFIVLTSPGY